MLCKIDLLSVWQWHLYELVLFFVFVPPRIILVLKITNLEEQLEQFREELENKNEEVQELLMQLEIQKKESTTRLQELQQENRLFKVIGLEE